MDYLKKKFSVSYGSKKYRSNWEKIFRKFNPLYDCPHVSDCLHVDGPFCNADCEMKDWTDEEWNALWEKEK